jgi:phosphoglycerate dehydrogenase-like enzyme
VSRPRIVIAGYEGVDLLGPEGHAMLVEVADVLDHEALGRWDDPRADALLRDADVLLGHWGCPPIDAAVLDRAPRLRLVAYAAGTVKGLLSDDVFDRGIRVTSGAPANAEPVAEFTLAAILFALKDVFWRRDRLRDPSLAGFRQQRDALPGNWGKTAGIVGASFVGRRVIELLRSFPHIAVALYDPYVTPHAARDLGARQISSLGELCRAVDVLSIHAPDLPSTRGMVGAAELAALRTGATVINTARGGLIDHEALVGELSAGRLYAVLDVTEPEPLPDTHPLRTLPNVFLTPHIAGSQGTELGRLAEQVVEEIRRWAAGEPPLNEVTKDALARLA